MYEMIAEYGTQGLTWILLALGAVLMRWVLPLVQNLWAAGVLTRAWTEVSAAVLEVGQTYVSALKAGAEDGKLTDAEKKDAKLQAIAIAKRNIGTKGLKSIAKIVGVDVEKWIGSKVETAVAATKPTGPAAGPQ